MINDRYQMGFIMFLVMARAVQMNAAEPLVYPNKTDRRPVLKDAMAEEIKFIGTVSPGGQNTCPVDGICSLMVDDIEVIWAVGWPQEPRGSMDEDINIGDKVEVYGKKKGQGVVTIYGSLQYYIKFISKGRVG